MENEVKTENTALVVSNINELVTNGKSEVKLYTNISDSKKLFNLENKIDNKINDCVGETIRVKEYSIKTIVTPLDPVVDEATGEVEEKFDRKRITILIDDEGKSYVTASKSFNFDFVKLLSMGALQNGEVVDIRIIKKSIKNSSNQALSFELV